MSVDSGNAGGLVGAGAQAPRPAAARPGDPAQRGAAPLSSEAKRRVRLAENQRKGFESAWNEYFDCYASTTYVEEPLIRLEDVSYHLYLKKHINPNNPHWELPSFRQLKKILSLSQDKIQGIEARLGAARLLVKDSGKGKGSKGENVANDYLLYEPLELAEFLLAVAEGRLPATLNEKGQRRLADIRARFCPGADTAPTSVPEAAPGGFEAPRSAPRAMPAAATQPNAAVMPSQTSNHAELSATPAVNIGEGTSAPPVSIFGTGGVSMAGVPENRTPSVPETGPRGATAVRTAPEPISGTQNTRPRTPSIQQTMQQQPSRAQAPGATRADDAPNGPVVVAGVENMLARQDTTPSQPDPLVARGITPLVALRLRQTCPAELIDRQIASFDALRDRDPGDPRLTPGRLRRQIEEDWTVDGGRWAVDGGPLTGDSGPSAAASPLATAHRPQPSPADRAEARAARLAAIGLGEGDQAVWARVVQAAPVLPALFRTALFHAPQGDGPAAVIFASRDDRDRALSPAHTATRARIAARLAAATPARPGSANATPIRYLAYDDLLALMHGE